MLIEDLIQEKVQEEESELIKHYPAMLEDDKKIYLLEFKIRLTTYINSIMEDMTDEETKTIYYEIYKYGELVREQLSDLRYGKFRISFEEICRIFTDIMNAHGVKSDLTDFILKQEKSNLQALHENMELKKENTSNKCYGIVYDFATKLLGNLEYYEEQFITN